MREGGRVSQRGKEVDRKRVRVRQRGEREGERVRADKEEGESWEGVRGKEGERVGKGREGLREGPEFGCIKSRK